MYSKKIQKLVLSVLIIIGLYFFAFNPIFIWTGGVGSIKFLYPLLLLMLFATTYQKNIKVISPLIKVFSWIIVYTIMEFLTGGSSQMIYVHIVAIIELLLLPCIISTLAINYNMDLYKFLYITAIFAAGLTLVCYLDPTVNMVVKIIQPEVAMDSRMIIQYRNFGLSSELSYGYAIALGIIAGCLWDKIGHSKLLLLGMPFIAFAILINARTGFIGLILSFFCYCFFSRQYKTIFVSIASLFLVCLAISKISLSWISDESQGFILEFFYQVEDLLTGSDKAQYSYADTYVNEMMILPDNIFQWIFGRGIDLRGASNEYAQSLGYSDEGWVTQLNYGGLVYIGLLLFYFIKLIKPTPKKWLLYFFIISSVLFNIKGNFFASNGGFRVLSLIVIYEAVLKSRYEQKSR